MDDTKHHAKAKEADIAAESEKKAHADTIDTPQSTGDADEMVQETERASLQGKAAIVPGRVYRWVRPFLGSRIANTVWQQLSGRRR